MAGFLKAFLIAIVAVAAIILFMNMAFFFPWYLEIVQTSFDVSQWVATDNYLPYDNYEDIYNTLKSRPIFKDRPDAVVITAVHEGGKNAIETGGPYDVDTYYYPLADEAAKPYVQMGHLVDITISAAYPFRMQIFGQPIHLADIPVTFHMTTTTTHHYKDLPYDYGPDGDLLDEYDG